MVRKNNKKDKYGPIGLTSLHGQNEAKVLNLSHLADGRKKKEIQPQYVSFPKSRAKGMAFVNKKDLEPVSPELVSEINALLQRNQMGIIGKLKRKLQGKKIAIIAQTEKCNKVR